jgi:hypothetical protein
LSCKVGKSDSDEISDEEKDSDQENLDEIHQQLIFLENSNQLKIIIQKSF